MTCPSRLCRTVSLFFHFTAVPTATTTTAVEKPFFVIETFATAALLAAADASPPVRAAASGAPIMKTNARHNQRRGSGGRGGANQLPYLA